MLKNIKTVMKTVALWHRVMDDTNAIPCIGGVLVPMRGYRRLEDFYLCVPAHGLYTRAACARRYGERKREYFMDGEFVGAGRMDNESRVRRLYDAGYKAEAKEYILGYRLFRETTLGGGHINPYKEAARISHVLCDTPGKDGHEERQLIRAMLLKRV